MGNYTVNEVFYSLQGEGVRAGTPAIFVRFAGCNLRCNAAEDGFDCDTDFAKGDKLDTHELFELVKSHSMDNGCANVIFTGGEPALQLDRELVARFKLDSSRPWHLAIETNGTVPIQANLDWICCSPKPNGGELHVHWANELKYVLARGQEPPDTPMPAEHLLVSPAFPADFARGVGGGWDDSVELEENVNWCIAWCLAHPAWRLSMQQHKLWRIR